MGNLNGWGGPVDEAFLRGQLALNRVGKTHSLLAPHPPNPKRHG